MDNRYYDPRYRPRPAALVLSALGRIGARAWIVIGLVVVVLLGLVTWAGIAVLSWLWGQVPMAADTGRRLAGEAATQIEQVAPGLKEQIDQMVPGLTQKAGELIPGRAADIPAADVSGADVGPVPRFQGLVRSHFSRRDGTAEVRYTGTAALEAVRTHYVQGFAVAGYTRDVIEATPVSEHLRFTSDQQTIELWMTRGPRDGVEVRLRAPAQ